MTLWTQNEIVDALNQIGTIAGSKTSPAGPGKPATMSVDPGAPIDQVVTVIMTFSDGNIATVNGGTIGDALEEALSIAGSYTGL